MQMFAQKFLISVVLLGFCCAVPASATLVTYCSAGACSAAGSAFTAETSDDTFQDIDVAQGDLGDTYTDPATTAAFSDLLGMVGTSEPSGWPAGTTGTAITSSSGPTTMTISLPSDVDAISFYLGAQDYTNLQISVTDSGGATFTNSSFGQTHLTIPVFFGVTTDSAFTSLTITSYAGVDKLTLDDIMIGSAGSDGGGDPSPTPEAATLLLVATGLFLMGYFRRRMPRRAAAQAARRGTVRTMFTGITPA